MTDFIGNALGYEPTDEVVVYEDYIAEIASFESHSEQLAFEHNYRRKKYGEQSYSDWQRSHALGKTRTPEQIQNYKVGAMKRLADPEYRTRLSEACKGKRKIMTCPHCNLTGAGGNMSRYHFDNCKKKL